MNETSHSPESSDIPQPLAADEGAGVPIEQADGAAGAEAAAPSPRRWRRHGRILWGEWLKPLLIIGLVMFSFRSAVADWNDVPTGSMKPTILEGDRIFINKVAYDLKFPFTTWRLAQWKDPAWGDVVVLRSPEDGKRLVKRVVGLPGDVLEIRGRILVRNGEPAVYRMLEVEGGMIYLDMEPPPALYTEAFDGRKHPIMLRGNGLHPPGPFIVPEGKFFVMGDNRNNSRDSRYFGPVDRSAILGQATAVALSLDREHYYKPRWQRFFSDLP
ncbi:MAG: signal peptidase I [Acidobacteriota bacterium]